MVYRIFPFYHFIYSSTVTSCDELAALFGFIYRIYNCKSLIWQLWTCVLSISEVNFIVGCNTCTMSP